MMSKVITDPKTRHEVVKFKDIYDIQGYNAIYSDLGVRLTITPRSQRGQEYYIVDPESVKSVLNANVLSRKINEASAPLREEADRQAHPKKER